MAGYKFQGPLGTRHNSPVIDKGTSCLAASCAPGPVGRSFRSANAEERPQVLLAYESWGHQYLSTQAIEAALKTLPSNLLWIRHFLIDTSTPSVYRDMTDIWTLAHWRATTQKHHFMRAKTHTQEAAYEEAVRWIRENAYRASYNLRRVWQESLGYFHPSFVNEPLGNAFHALQDSFSAGHVTRKKSGDVYVITAIHVYDKTNKEIHSELDKQWQSPLGKEAILACRELTKVIVVVALQKLDRQFEQKWESLWSTFEKMFLQSLLERQ